MREKGTDHARHRARARAQDDPRESAAGARAFEVFPAGAGRWWPKSHHIGQAEMQDAVMEPRAGGRWYERGTDGSECEWGRVLAWEPPHRLVLAWQLNADWRYDPDLITEVEVRFTPDGQGTRVDLEHRGLERFGAQAEAVRGQIDSEGGWPLILQLFADAAA